MQDFSWAVLNLNWLSSTRSFSKMMITYDYNDLSHHDHSPRKFLHGCAAVCMSEIEARACDKFTLWSSWNRIQGTLIVVINLTTVILCKHGGFFSFTASLSFSLLSIPIIWFSLPWFLRPLKPAFPVPVPIFTIPTIHPSFRRSSSTDSNSEFGGLTGRCFASWVNILRKRKQSNHRVMRTTWVFFVSFCW